VTVRGHRASPGFTLVELLIALAIVGALLAIAFGGLRVAMGAWRQGEERTEAHQHVRGLAVLLARAMGGIYPYRAAAGDSPEPEMLFSGAAERLEFVTQVAPFPFPIPVAFTAVVLSLEAGQGLIVRERALPNRDPFTEAAVVLRDASVTTLGFRYLGDTDWDDTWTDTKNLPRAVEITLGTTVNGRPHRLPPLTISLKYQPLE
jgi:general secretion pathway protein J